MTNNMKDRHPLGGGGFVCFLCVFVLEDEMRLRQTPPEKGTGTHSIPHQSKETTH